MRALRHQIFAAALGLICGAADATACSPSKPGPFLQKSAETSACAHPLCGRIFPTAETSGNDSAKPCPDDEWKQLKAEATAALASGGVLILGETHDNATHHLLQAAAIKEFALSVPGNETAIVFEQFREDQQPAIDATVSKLRDGKTVTAAELKEAVGWQKSGWPDLYDPLIDFVIAAKRSFYAGDVSRADIMKAAKGGPGSLPADEQMRLALDVPLGDKYDEASIKEIEEAHCGALPKEAFGGMAFAQRYRDAHLADVTLNAAMQGSAILIAGTGHARADRGVPWYLHRRASEKKVVSVLFVEVEDGNSDPQSYIPRDPDGRPAADFLVFTPRAERSDPCEKMRKK